MPDRNATCPGSRAGSTPRRSTREAALAFYGDLFGWEFEDRMPADSPTRYYVAQLAGRDVAAVGSQDDDPGPGPVWNTYIAVESADENAAAAKRAGGTMIAEPFDVGDVGRMGVVSDPAGALFCTWEAKTFAGAQAVNEAGTWNWSTLNTRDAARSKDFYGELFGWEADEVDLGGTTATMVRRPGYGDSLEEIDPGIKKRHREGGAPEGFTDCITWIVEIGDEFPANTPSHWGVTFAVDDADAVAARAAELGGRVVVEPFDAGPSRTATLSDPQGAVFSINKYTPSD